MTEIYLQLFLCELNEFNFCKNSRCFIGMDWGYYESVFKI
jgi:hypothetical protein